jgi:hypothetical protein
VLVLLLAGIAWTGWSSLAKTKANMDIVINENVVKIKLSNDMRQALNVVARGVRNYILYPDLQLRKTMAGRIEEGHKTTSEAYEKLGPCCAAQKTRNSTPRSPPAVPRSSPARKGGRAGRCLQD